MFLGIAEFEWSPRSSSASFLCWNTGSYSISKRQSVRTKWEDILLFQLGKDTETNIKRHHAVIWVVWQGWHRSILHVFVLFSQQISSFSVPGGYAWGDFVKFGGTLQLLHMCHGCWDVGCWRVKNCKVRQVELFVDQIVSIRNSSGTDHQKSEEVFTCQGIPYKLLNFWKF